MQFLVASWLANGCSSRCPEEAKSGRQRTDMQRQVQAQVHCSVARWCRPGVGTPGGGLKFGALLVEDIEREGTADWGCDAEGKFEPTCLSAVHVPLRSERIRFGVGLAKLNPLGYLECFTAAAFLEPEVLRRRQEVVRLARRWDVVGRLRLFAAGEVPARRVKNGTG